MRLQIEQIQRDTAAGRDDGAARDVLTESQHDGGGGGYGGPLVGRRATVAGDKGLMVEHTVL